MNRRMTLQDIPAGAEYAHTRFLYDASVNSRELAGVMVELWDVLEKRFGGDKARLILHETSGYVEHLEFAGGRPAIMKRLHYLEDHYDGSADMTKSIAVGRWILQLRQGERVNNAPVRRTVRKLLPGVKRPKRLAA